MNKKQLTHYLTLNYRLQIRKVDKYEKIFYEATTRELDSLTFYGVGDTIQEAVDSLEEVKVTMFEYYLVNGIDIPVPEEEPDRLPSGRFVLRIPPQLHKRLIDLASDQRRSLNNLVTSIIESFITVGAVVNEARSMLEPKGAPESEGVSKWNMAAGDNITRISSHEYPTMNEASNG